MYQPPSKPSAQQRSIRLPKQMAIPGYGDISFLMQEAQKMSGRIVEMPFASSDRKSDFVLAVRYESKDIDPEQQMDPEWSLTQYTGGPPKILWKHPCRDLSLICNLLASSAGGDQLQDVIPSSALYGSAGESANTGAYNPVATTSGLSPTRTASSVGQPESTATILFEPPKPGAKATLEGDLNKLQVPNLLQSINLAKMTGRLDIKTKADSCQVYFQEGIPLHCKLKENVGDHALCELITWLQGEFRFWPDEKTQERSINKRLDAVLMEGVTLLDQWKYLETAGLKQESCLVRKNAMMSEQEFAARLEKGAPIALEPQIEFYDMIDNRSTVYDITQRKRPMDKTQWVPILFNLVSCGLVQITDQAPTQNRLARLKALGVDENQFQSVIKSLTRSETGILNYYAFIYFLEQEYLRYEYFNLPFSLILFSLGVRRGGEDSPMVEALQMIAIRRAMQRIGLVKRQIDVLGHYETFDYAILLPNANAAAAGALANRIADVLREAPLSSDMDSRSLALAFGVASMPEDGVDLDKLIMNAKKARDEAKAGKRRVVLARDFTSQEK